MTNPDGTKRILQNYEYENIGVKTNLCRLLNHGKLANTGKLIILPVDQGFEHGPYRSFSPNSQAYDPDYHFRLAIESGINGYAAPLGMLQTSANNFLGSVPLILKLNNGNNFPQISKTPDQAITASVKDALNLGCVGIGFTIYPGSEKNNEMIEEAREVIKEARDYGLFTIIWSYPRGELLENEKASSLDVICYAAHLACLIGAHIVKVKPPNDVLSMKETKICYEKYGIPTISLKQRIERVKLSCFNGKRLVIFSGGSAKSEENLLEEFREIKNGGGDGLILGRNSFQRSFDEGKKLLENAINIFH